MNVNNKGCIRKLSLKTMKYSKARNIIAAVAIALTSVLFTALFTIVGSIADGMEQSNFRMVGTCAHGEFKRLSEEQYNILKNDKDIAEYGLRRFAGATAGEEFAKRYAEVSYMNKTCAEWSFVTPEKGRLPDENTNEAAADTMTLSLMGITPEIGAEFTVSMDVDGAVTEKTFTLCGWWEYDPAAPACHILIPESRLDEILNELDTQCYDGMTGRYSLDVMLKSYTDIETKLSEILERNGFSSNPADDNYIALGINWGYMSESLLENMDISTVASIALIILLIILVGYLIIYNIFRISVSNDIRRYGMLKTIGTTGRQIRRMIYIQAGVLSAAGIPVGLAAGWVIGAVLAPVIINELNMYQNTTAAVNPVIFIFSALFALATVFISCMKPASIAAKVSPIEALRYTEASGKAQSRKSSGKISPISMAMANLGRSKGKTALTVISLALSLVLFSLTHTFANSFSMEKYLSDITADFIVSDGSYLNVLADWSPDTAIPEEEIEALRSMDGVTNSFVSYGIATINSPSTFYTEEYVRERLAYHGNDEVVIDNVIANSEKLDGLVEDNMQILGVEESAFEKIDVIEGDISKLSEKGYIAVEKSEYFRLGDKLTIKYTDSITYKNTQTGEIYESPDDIEDMEWMDIDISYETHYAEYEICAVLDIPHAIGYRYYLGADLFLLGAEEYLAENKNAAPLCLAFDTTDEAEPVIEEFLSKYTENSTLDYESKARTAEEFESFKEMFVILGTALSLIVGMIGVFNFTNTILTGIFSRGREFAVLQSIGMTGKQLKAMLISEGLFYTATAAVSAIVINLLTIPMASVLEKMFWFCEYKFTPLPTLSATPVFIIMGIAVPLITYCVIGKKPVVERLREYE